MKAVERGSWLLVTSTAFAFASAMSVVACGSDVGGPQATTSGAAIEGPCEGDGCGDCRPVTIRTVTGKTVEVCGNDEAVASGGDDMVGQAGHDDEPVANEGANGDSHDDHDGGLGSERAAADASIGVDQSDDRADAAHADDAEIDAGVVDAANHDAGLAADSDSDVDADADADAGADDAAADCGSH